MGTLRRAPHTHMLSTAEDYVAMLLRPCLNSSQVAMGKGRVRDSDWFNCSSPQHWVLLCARHDSEHSGFSHERKPADFSHFPAAPGPRHKNLHGHRE